MGQDIGYGMSFHPERSSAEFALVDMGRTDGVKYGGGGVYVSPFDYLEDSEKKKLVEAYKKHVIEPYLREGKKSEFFKPFQPYLTNNLFLHQGNEGKLTGEWYCLSSRWGQSFPNDLLTFIVAENPYYSGNVVLAADDQDEGGKTDWSIEGTFEVDYEKGRIEITNYDGSVYFGIFEIDESGDRAKLKIEYQKDSYPTEFSSKAVIYIERTNLPRREDALGLGLIDSM
jgi:hypothetical protein